MKATYLLFLTLTIADVATAQNPTPIATPNTPTMYRETYTSAVIPVWRFPTTAYLGPVGGRRMSDAENLAARLFPEATLVYSLQLYPDLRNCHDFAWASWMAVVNGYNPFQNTSDPQAWWMNDPRRNWVSSVHGPSFHVAVESYSRSTSINPMLLSEEHLFYTADFDWLIRGGLYQTSLGSFCWLPVVPSCSDDVEHTPPPVHSAVLIDSVVCDYPGDGTLSYGIYMSKWGFGGLYRHRWGYGYCPDVYCVQQPLRVFVPNWPGPPYPLWPYTPW